MNFTAIDFETAVGQDSICAVGIVSVVAGKIAEEYYQLIQPPGNRYSWYTTRVHGLTSRDTQNAPTFSQVYPEIRQRICGQTLVAHNEAFDRSALRKTATRHGLDYHALQLPDRWECTKKIFKRRGFKPCDLASLCARFSIALDHHEALSDARACALLYLVAQTQV